MLAAIVMEHKMFRCILLGTSICFLSFHTQVTITVEPPNSSVDSAFDAEDSDEELTVFSAVPSKTKTEAQL